ncbi:TonB-dependent receptor plug domain-containing protein [Spirosoma taeanense]|uniref:TonB-dependent receptor plug domain-containing protein n=1 Tax=Spirosoma taeanense TaxID=2735870 RepID=UPI001F042CBF|nr:TonB-dependent receptor plug domain-containing protein [Spirosoma taeanense]
MPLQRLPAQTQRDNFLNALQGRVAGVQVATTSGLPGSSSQVIIRGVNSISGNNQPLYVIDEMPIDNN